MQGLGVGYGLVLLGLYSTAACLSIPVPGRGPADSGERLGWKVVLEKRQPNLLIAVDRSYCEVSYDRFERVDEGERAFCHWR